MSGTMQLRKSAVLLGLLVATALGGAFGWVGTALLNSSSSTSGPLVPLFLAGETPARAAEVSFLSGFTPIVKSALPAVVNVSTSKKVQVERENSPFSGPFRDFFGPDFLDQFGGPRERQENSLGSGVIVSSDGYILTNNHVVQGATDIDVFLSNERRLKGRIIGGDAKTDIAVIKVEEKSLPALTLGNSAGVQVGDFALAIGNPFGVGQTVTMGIVGATGRGGFGIEHYEDFIQTDAAINPGNSGGALINVRGELIGINTAIVARSGGSQGVGFAVPTNMARPVMEQILKQGKVIRGYLGVNIQTMTPELAKSFGSKTTQGALISDVVPDGPAAKAGLRRGDIVLAVNGEPVLDSRRLTLTISQAAPGTAVDLKLLREGQEQNIRVTLGELPSDPERAQAPGVQRGQGSTALGGVAVDNLTPDIARQLNLPPQTSGVVVVQVSPQTAAATGLRRGDVIEEVNRRSVSTVGEYEQAVRQAGGGEVLLLLNRGGSSLYIVIGQNR
jgi:serine protease Do